MALFYPVSVFCQGSPFYPNDPYFFYNATQRPYFPGQWHLENNAPSEISWAFPNQPDGPDWYKNQYHGKIVVMKNAEVDTNIVDAWKMGYTGKGVVIGIVDDGVEGTHEDIAPNYNAALSRKFLGGKIYENQGPVNQKDNHGTAVAGVAAAPGEATVSAVQELHHMPRLPDFVCLMAVRPMKIHSMPICGKAA